MFVYVFVLPRSEITFSTFQILRNSVTTLPNSKRRIRVIAQPGCFRDFVEKTLQKFGDLLDPNQGRLATG